MEDLGIKVLLGRTTTAVLGNGHVEGVALVRRHAASKPTSSSSPPASGRTSSSAYKAGLHVNRGIVVNDYMETSRPDIFAVGECVEHRGVCYGLVAPLFEQGKVLAATITGNKGPTYTGTVQAAKLKIMGVDVFSAGDWSEQNAEPVRYEDRALGVYKKLTVRDGKLAGVILVGDTSDSHRYMEWLRTQRRPHRPAAASAVSRRRRPTPGSTSRRWPTAPPSAAASASPRAPSSQAIHEQGVNTLSQLKECTRASTGCGSCTQPVPGPAARRRAGVRGRGARR